MSKAHQKDADKDSRIPKNAEDERWRELMRRGDRVGIRYLQATQLKRKRKLTKAERDFLKQFEDDRKRILRDPESVTNKGLENIHRGLMLLESVIREKQARNISEEMDAALYYTVCLLSGVAVALRNDIIRYAEDGMPWACNAIFRDGKALASAFSRLAIAWPEHFQYYAEQSLVMPSLRTRNPDFTCDAEAISHSIHLAEKCHAINLHDNRTRIGALCHRFMAEIVDLRLGCRQEASEKGDTDSQSFNLPELKRNAKAWWKAELKKRVHKEFEWMKQYPRRNPALWQELEKVTDHGTNSAKRAALEKYCYNKLEQMVGKQALPASPR